MNKKKYDKLKKLIVIIFFILVIILAVIVFIMLTNVKSPDIDTDVNDVSDENINENSKPDESTNQDNSSSFENTESDDTDSSDEDIRKIVKVTDMYSYFWLKDILEKYYASNNLENPINIIDDDVVNELNLTVDNYKKYNNFDDPIFRIDEMYGQILDSDRKMFIVKHKVGKTENDSKESIVWIEEDENIEKFTVFPYEYLRLKGYLNFKVGDTLPIEPERAIKDNDENSYTEIKKIDTDTCMKGLFERLKFDLMIDQDHLYGSLDEEYKKAKYPELNDLKRYINNNKTDLMLDVISEYKLSDFDTSYVEYRAICDSGRNYIFRAKNMLDYTLFLDEYTMGKDKTVYSIFLPQAQARYCIDRVVQAMNYEDYDFVYSKLNQIQKSNYYKNINDFKQFLQKNSYSENNYEIDENYLKISDNVYQFYVKIGDATGKDFSYIRLIMTVTLKDNEDFEIAIVTDK